MTRRHQWHYNDIWDGKQEFFASSHNQVIIIARNSGAVSIHPDLVLSVVILFLEANKPRLWLFRFWFRPSEAIRTEGTKASWKPWWTPGCLNACIHDHNQWKETDQDLYWRLRRVLPQGSRTNQAFRAVPIGCYRVLSLRSMVQRWKNSSFTFVI